MNLGDRIGIGFGDRLNFHAALRAQHTEIFFGGTIQCEARVILLTDIRSMFNPKDLDNVAFDIEAENVGGVLTTLVGVHGQFHAAGFTATAHQYLGLHDDGIPHPLCGGQRVVDRADSFTRRDGNAILSKHLLALIFEKIHCVPHLVGCRKRILCGGGCTVAI